MTTAPRVQSASPDTLVTTIVETVAGREGVPATELTPPLHTAIDPDALTALFAPTRRGVPRDGGRVEFEYCGYEIVVQGDGRVSVTDGKSSPRDSAQVESDARH